MKLKLLLLPIITALALSTGPTKILSMERAKFKTTRTVQDLRNIVQKYRNNNATALEVLDTFYKIVDQPNKARSVLDRLGLSLDQLRTEVRKKGKPAAKLTPKKPKTPIAPQPKPRAVPTAKSPKAPQPEAPFARTPVPPRVPQDEFEVDPTAPRLRRRGVPIIEEASEAPQAEQELDPTIILLPGPEASSKTVTPSDTTVDSPRISQKEFIDPTAPSLRRRDVPTTEATDKPQTEQELDPTVILLPGPEAKPQIAPEPAAPAQQQPVGQVRVRFQIPEHTPIIEFEDRGYTIGQDDPRFIQAVTDWDGRTINQVAQALDRAANNDVLRLQVLRELLKSMTGDVHPFTKRKIKLLAQPLINSYQNQNDDEFTNVRKIIRNIL